MATTLNAGTATGGAAISADTSGILQLQSGSTPTTAVTIDASQVASFTNNLGTVAGYPAYQCRAWVNFNGTGTVAIRASGNVSSITDNGSGDYDVNFVNAMPDVNYSVSGIAMRDSANIAVLCIFGNATYTTSFVATTKVRVNVRDNANNNVDAIAVCVSIFR